MSAGTVGGFRAREEAEKQKREQERAAAASRQAQQSEQGKAAHRAAVLEAYKRGKETPGAQRSTVRTTFTADTATTVTKEKTSGRSSSRDRRQFSQSDAPVNLQGDPRAIQEVRARAFQQAREKAARTGGKVDEAAVNRETRNILASSRGRVSIVDESSRRQAIEQGYREFKGQKAIPESDMAIMTPVRGIRSRSTYEGFFEGGGRTTVSIGPPKVEKVTAVLPPPPDNFFEGAKTNLQNLGVDLELGARGTGIGIGSIFAFANPDAQKNLIKDAETQGRIAEGKRGRELEREFIGATIESGVGAAQGKPTTEGFSQLGKDIVESPRFFAGSAFSSAAVWIGPGAAFRIGRFASEISLGSRIAYRLKTGTPYPVAIRKFQVTPRAYGENFPSLRDVALEDYRFGLKNTPDFRQQVGAFVEPFKPLTLSGASKSSSVFSPKDIQPEIKDLPPMTVQKRMTTMADIDKRLGLDVKDKGDFSEVRTRTGQVLLVKKPIQIQKPLVITKQETTFAPPRQTTRTIQRQQSQSVQQFMLGFGGQTGFERVLAKRARQRLGLQFNTPQIEREAIQQAQSLSSSQRSLFGQQQSFKSAFKQNQITKVLQLERQQLKFKPITLERQLFKFVFPRPTRTTTTFDIPPPPSPPPVIPTTTIPTPPAFPWLMGALRYGQKKAKKGRTRATPREGQIKDLISASLGDSNKFAKSFRRRFGKMF